MKESDQDDPYQTKPKEVYIDKPLVDEEWLALYKEDVMKIERKHEKKLTKRLLCGTKKVREW